ncbi:ensconsin-like [Uloborus diversus]|uniref:ensconsin-like n=1 Tax=Uloborus diversus TaxID=327109 RepID=UPI00240A5747|nr:ensconsin-like [Uloborus diversus]
MASVNNIGLNYEENKVDNEKKVTPTGMSGETSPSTLNKIQSRESYWFAHGGLEDSFKNAQSKLPADPKDLQNQKDKEERIRIFREQQEEERLKRLKDLEQQFLQSKKHREQQEEERKRKIEEARVRELERRQQVEERKRQIWEAEQERKEAILRRNMEREARIEARRNAQRNSQCFAFGSSTPRSFDLDLAAIGIGRNTGQGSVLMSSVSSRKSEERELGPPRATSACSLDRKFDTFSQPDIYSNDYHYRSSSLEPDRVGNLSKHIAMQHKSSDDMKACLSMWENSPRPNFFLSPSSGWLTGSGVLVGDDCMSRSMVSLSSSSGFRGRKRTDITPTLTRERSITPHVTPRGNHAMRAVSMTRLDQLAQPRRTYSRMGTTTPNPGTVSPSMSKSMCNLANAVGRRLHAPPVSSSSSGRGSMSRSMMHLGDISAQKDTQRLSPTSGGMRSAQSMLHLAPAPRLTRAARLRAQALAHNRALSAWNLNKPDSSMSGYYPGKDTSRSPSRPQSSMSGASEVSLPSSSVSAVNMRPRPAPRKPRPYSVAVDHLVSSSLATEKKSLERQPRVAERTAPTNDLHQRAKSVGRENTKPLVAAKKPIPPPKSSQVLARAKSHPMPLKDNLRKPVKPGFEPTSTVSSKVKHQNEKQSSKETETKPNNLDIESKLDPASTEAVKGSPVTDSEMCISSDDSKVSAVTESETNTRSVTESEPKVEDQPQVVVPDVIKEINVSKEPKEAEKSEKEVLKVSLPEKISSEVVVNESPQNETLDTESSSQNDASSSKPRITSEEEARAALAEKRRLAREQAEREAELERQRQEEIKRKEEEQKRLEELEQKRMEEEQIRLAELHRKLEEEKLRKAIEEQQQREREEQERREEEARQKLEKEEQERKAREEAEKQKIELEERLRKEEEERAERKRRVEQIMARTRGKGSAQSPSSPQVENNTMKVNSESLIENVKNSVSTNSLSNGGSHSKVEQNVLFSSATGVISENSSSVVDEKKILNNHLPDLLNSEIIANHSNQKNGLHSESDKLFSSNSVSNFASNRTLSANDAAFSNQTNGYSSHEDMSCTTSPEDISSSGLLISIENSQQSSKIQSESSEFSKLVDLESSLNNINNDNYLINVDNVNSNLLTSESSYLTFDETLQKKQDSSITDLLS